MAKRKQPPCMGCQDRKANCHGKCQRYAAFRKEKDAKLDRRMKETDFEDFHYKAVIKSILCGRQR